MPAYRKTSLFVLFVVFGLLIASISLVNRMVETEVQDREQLKVKSTPAVSLEQPSKVPTAKSSVRTPVSGKVYCRKVLDPNHKFYENVFMVDGQEIARFKSVGEKTFDQSGAVPDGEVAFQNNSTRTYGIEHYLDGKRQGEYLEYYQSGQLKREAMYAKGKLKTTKEYFIDGKLRMEQDLTDAMWITDNDEVGVGKIYYRTGILMYEWSLTNKEKGGYNKSYNNSGSLVEANYFDVDGKLIRTQKFDPTAALQAVEPQSGI